MTHAMRFWLGPSRPLARFVGGRPVLLFAATLLAAGCAPPGARSASGPVSPSANRSAPLPSPEAQPGNSTRAPGAAASAALLPRLPEIVLDPKAPLRPLPELKVENIGLHVGGGPNDADTKAPFQRAVAQRFPAFLDCYRKNEDPAKGGRFGIDLHIARGGGHPHIEQPRTAMRGPEFRACVSAAFESVEFDKPKRGPTTVSYSLHFTVGEAP